MRNDLGDLSAFAVVAEERSFTRAAARLGVSQSALSHSMRGLEKRLGLQLLARTTRSVSPTAAGAALLKDLLPSLERIERSLGEVRQQRERPAGKIRLALSRTAAHLVLLPKLERFVQEYPEIVLETTSVNDPVDLVAGEFDAGIQIGEFIQREMIAVRVSADMRLAAFASPEYFAQHKPPRSPRDLREHSCIAFRFRSGVYRWEFERGKRAMTFAPQGPLSADDPEMVVQAALRGVGIGMAMEPMVTPLIAEGKLVQVLREWCPVFPGFFLYYPSRRNQPAALAALVAALRLSE
ncbi:LysR family transcriptional regulator [Granulicella cerasi]|uniref:LysR family transcriptional regulator n=1 Tax=Granulicella cerasi TaxID=741063 RepID=A0ABW1Z7Y8_9BACT|nr:LysR family transcriptional regulator [Granulicella cerasi]